MHLFQFVRTGPRTVLLSHTDRSTIANSSAFCRINCARLKGGAALSFAFRVDQLVEAIHGSLDGEVNICVFRFVDSANPLLCEGVEDIERFIRYGMDELEPIRYSLDLLYS